jgi:Icc-related predicted phosphoesterase
MKMDVIAISDIYSDTKITTEFTELIKQIINNKPIIIIAGDIGIKTASHRYHQSINEIIYSLSKISKQIFYIPGDSDSKELEISAPNIKNLDRQNYIIKDDEIKVGLMGLGGAPSHSMRNTDLSPYLWDESIPVVRESIMTELKIQIEKIAQENPDYLILVTHSPPYGIADRSKPITLHETHVLEDILEELTGEIKTEEAEAKEKEKTKKVISIRHLGSRVISDFIKYYKPDINIFGHVHKEGGKTETREATKFFNVSHLSPLPYKLTGRKFFKIKLTKETVSYSFHHVVVGDVTFDSFIDTYL